MGAGLPVLATVKLDVLAVATVWLGRRIGGDDEGIEVGGQRRGQRAAQAGGHVIAGPGGVGPVVGRRVVVVTTGDVVEVGMPLGGEAVEIGIDVPETLGGAVAGDGQGHQRRPQGCGPARPAEVATSALRSRWRSRCCRRRRPRRRAPPGNRHRWGRHTASRCSGGRQYRSGRRAWRRPTRCRLRRRRQLHRSRDQRVHPRLSLSVPTTR